MFKLQLTRSATRTASLRVVVTGCVLLCAACGSSSTGSTSEGKTSAKHVSIGIVETFTSIPFFQNAAVGAKAAGTEDGHATVQVVGPAQATGTAEATMAQNLQQSLRPDGFGPNPCILPAWTTTLAGLVRQVPGGNVVAWDCLPISSPSQTSPVKTFVGSTALEQGYQGAETAIKASGVPSSTTGTALVANCDKGVPLLDDGQIGLVAAVKKLLPKVTVVQFATALDQTGDTAAWTSKFGSSSNVVFAAGSCDQDTTSLALLKQRHVGGDFVAAATDVTSPADFKAIESGLISGGVSAAPWVEGNVTVHMLIDAARGVKLPVGWIDTGLYPVTKVNAAQWLAGTSSDEAQAAFFAPYAKQILSHLNTLVQPMSKALSLQPVEGS